MKKRNVVSIILVTILILFIGYYLYQQFNKEEIKAYEMKLINYSNEIKKIIENYSFESTLVDKEWLNQINSNVSCQEVYYYDDKVLLHECEVLGENGKYYFYDKPYLEENIEYKKIYETIKNNKLVVEKGNLLSDLVTIDFNLGISSIEECANEGQCQPGTVFAIQVNDSDIYKFYVLYDDGEKVKLIMDKNIINYVNWAASDNLEGPVDAIYRLQDATSNWTNIPLRNYRIKDDNKEKVYSDIHIKTRAIIPSYTEMIKEEGNTASWLYTNLNNGYWLSSASRTMSFYAWVLKSDGTISPADVSSEEYGIRPMIILYK